MGMWEGPKVMLLAGSWPPSPSPASWLTCDLPCLSSLLWTSATLISRPHLGSRLTRDLNLPELTSSIPHLGYFTVGLQAGWLLDK